MVVFDLLFRFVSNYTLLEWQTFDFEMKIRVIWSRSFMWHAHCSFTNTWTRKHSFFKIVWHWTSFSDEKKRKKSCCHSSKTAHNANCETAFIPFDVFDFHRFNYIPISVDQQIQMKCRQTQTFPTPDRVRSFLYVCCIDWKHPFFGFDSYKFNKINQIWLALVFLKKKKNVPKNSCIDNERYSVKMNNKIGKSY